MSATTLRLRRDHALRAPEISVLVGCPDARPPAYEAVAGLAREGRLSGFATSFYAKKPSFASKLVGTFLPGKSAQIQRLMNRRRHRLIPADRVISHASVDLSLTLESKFGTRIPGLKRALARSRTERFDRQLSRVVQVDRPDVLLTFSDVGSRHTLPRCRKLGIPTILSMVTGEIHEELEVLAREAERAPEFLPIYLGDGQLDRGELAWLHSRRLDELALADMILVPSEHIANKLSEHGTDRSKIVVIPYAADTTRFHPLPNKSHEDTCTFLFAGGITQRKGIKDLLEAWQFVKRPGWRLQLLGALPKNPGPLTSILEGVELLGRVGHSEVADRMASADVFVFPSLFEGSAVVTYEALACGLPSIVTPNAGSVVRDGEDGMIVPAADPATLANAMEKLGTRRELRAIMAESARQRALEFDWNRYQTSIGKVVAKLVEGSGS